MSSLARPNARSLALAANILQPHRLLSGLAYALGTVQIADALNGESDQPLHLAIPRFYIEIGRGELPENMGTTAILEVSRRLMALDEDGLTLAHLHQAVMLGALEHYFRERGIGWTEKGGILQGHDDADEYAFMALYRYIGRLLGVPSPLMNAASSYLRSQFDVRMADWSSRGRVISLAGAIMFWNLALDSSFNQELNLSADEILEVLRGGMYPDDSTVMRGALEIRREG